jgi:hypothetical protein
LNGLSGGPDHIEHEVGLGEHGAVAAVGLGGGGAHALREEALQLGVNGTVVLAIADRTRSAAALGLLP